MDPVLEIFVYISVADNKQLGIFYLNIKNKKNPFSDTLLHII